MLSKYTLCTSLLISFILMSCKGNNNNPDPEVLEGQTPPPGSTPTPPGVFHISNIIRCNQNTTQIQLNGMVSSCNSLCQMYNQQGQNLQCAQQCPTPTLEQCKAASSTPIQNPCNAQSTDPNCKLNPPSTTPTPTPTPAPGIPTPTPIPPSPPEDTPDKITDPIEDPVEAPPTPFELFISEPNPCGEDFINILCVISTTHIKDHDRSPKKREKHYFYILRGRNKQYVVDPVKSIIRDKTVYLEIFGLPGVRTYKRFKFGIYYYPLNRLGIPNVSTTNFSGKVFTQTNGRIVGHHDYWLKYALKSKNDDQCSIRVVLYRNRTNRPALHFDGIIKCPIN